MSGKGPEEGCRRCEALPSRNVDGLPKDNEDLGFCLALGLE